MFLEFQQETWNFSRSRRRSYYLITKENNNISFKLAVNLIYALFPIKLCNGNKV